jgi:nucleotide-binding universal stress UspA family protein
MPKTASTPLKADPLDVAVAHFRFEHALGITHATQPEMADIGLGGDESHGRLVAQLAAAKIGVHDHGELVGRSVAGRALHGADHNRSRRLDELLPGLLGLHRVFDVADRLRVALGAEAFHFLESEFRSGSDDQEVVIELAAVDQFELVLVGQHALAGNGNEIDVLLSKRLAQVHLDFFALSPVHRDPGIGRHEVKAGGIGNHRDAVIATDRSAHFVGQRQPADACAHDDDVSHVFFLLCAM